jgi:propionate catabolism operon transcriptional regulator
VESEVLETLYGQLTLVAKSPIMVDEQSVGVLFTCRNVEALRETEHKIRKEMSKKGLVAHYRFSNIISENPKMKMLIATAYKYSQVDSNVFIIGNRYRQGVFAQKKPQRQQACSQRSWRSTVPAFGAFVGKRAFGLPRGFSGRSRVARWLVRTGPPGTLFLDEIGECRCACNQDPQGLQEKEIRKIGGDTVVPVDVRIIATTSTSSTYPVRAIPRGPLLPDQSAQPQDPPMRSGEDIEVVLGISCNVSTEAGKLAVHRPEVIELMKGFSWLQTSAVAHFSERMAILNEWA